MGVLTLGAAALTQPAPPTTISIAGGQAASSYDRAGAELGVLVTADEGPKLVVRDTGGSGENLKLLAAGGGAAAEDGDGSQQCER